jgi:hypothetical protein
VTTLHFTGRAELMASYQAWWDVWLLSCRYEHHAAMNAAQAAQDRLLPALRDTPMGGDGEENAKGSV